ncbi:alanine racemase [Marinobacterium arenosum]|uniref:alanine racemase n=1 Tax=Marinobacterium arenosum TaxID=2862496 RepID=UPI001C965C9A|nr:alanine racemase [Marinobacterium arenosum]MBY4677692.1 alanine racemase [Marinobacterium arenosum]
MSRQARALIDLDAIRANYRLACAQSPQSQAVAIVKADAYGHGATRVAAALEPEVPAFGVACIEEAIALREAGITRPILLLEGFFQPDELPIIVEQNFWTALHSEHQIDQIAALPESAGLHVWLKMDSGMHRLGVAPEHYADAFRRLKALPQVAEVVLMSHFACADELDNDFTRVQIERFRQATEGLDAPVSLANSPATLGWPQARQDLMRPGLMLYGASPFGQPQVEADKLQPAMTLLSEVIAVREIEPGESVGYACTWTADQPSRVGTVAMGYGDGFPRHAKNGTPVLIDGQRSRIIGRVSMDMLTVDLTDLPQAGLGSTVEFWGANLSINEVAPWCDTIPYTLMTCLTGRIPRIYRGD